MLAIDDQLTRLDAEDAANGRARLNRRTGRMRRITSHAAVAQRYVRQLVGELTDEELEWVRRTRLKIWEEDEGKMVDVTERASEVEDEAML